MPDRRSSRPRHRRPDGSRDPVRSVRISDAVWLKGRRRALDDGITPSEVISTLYRGYAEGRIDMPRIQEVYAPLRQETVTEATA